MTKSMYRVGIMVAVFLLVSGSVIGYEAAAGGDKPGHAVYSIPSKSSQK